LNHEKKLETSEDNIVGGAVNSDDATGTDTGNITEDATGTDTGNITEDATGSDATGSDATGSDSHDSVKPSSWLFRSVNELNFVLLMNNKY